MTDDTHRLQEILRRYHAAATKSGNQATISDVEHIMRMFNLMYPEFYKNIMQNNQNNS